MRYPNTRTLSWNIDKAINFHCMENQSYVSDSLWKRKKESALFLKDYYKKNS